MTFRPGNEVEEAKASPGLPPEVVDQKPDTDEHRDAIRALLYDQAQELRTVDARVTCPCGYSTPLRLAFHCYQEMKPVLRRVRRTLRHRPDLLDALPLEAE